VSSGSLGKVVCQASSHESSVVDSGVDVVVVEVVEVVEVEVDVAAVFAIEIDAGVDDDDGGVDDRGVVEDGAGVLVSGSMSFRAAKVLSLRRHTSSSAWTAFAVILFSRAGLLAAAATAAGGG